MNQLAQKVMPVQPMIQHQVPVAPVNQLSAAAQPTMADQVQNPQHQSGGAYNGTVDVKGQPVQVKDGIAEMGGKRYFVSIDGSIVMDEQRQLVGKIENGKFEPTNEAQIAELKKKGIVE